MLSLQVCCAAKPSVVINVKLGKGMKGSGGRAGTGHARGMHPAEGL